MLVIGLAAAAAAAVVDVIAAEADSVASCRHID